MPRVEPRPAAAATATWRRQRRRLHRGRWQCSPRRAAARSRFHRPPTLTASAPTREARAGSVRRAPASVLTGPMVASASSPSWSAMRRDRKMVAAPRRERRRPPASMRRGRPARLRREWQRRHQEDRRPPIGPSAPSAIGMPSRPAAVRMRLQFVAAMSRETLPPVAMSATSSTPGSVSAHQIATASSVPPSVSMTSGSGHLTVPHHWWPTDLPGSARCR